MAKVLNPEVIEHFCGVVYRDLNPTKIFNKFNDFKFDMYAFDLRKNTRFREDVINVYFMKYPKEHDKNELSLLLKEICDVLQEKYKSTNSIGLVKLLISKLFYVQNDQLILNFKMLFRWDGLINRIDLNFLISCAVIELSAGNSKETIEKTPYIPRNDNNRLAQKLENGFSENHAHLKASGYIYEQNIGRYLESAEFSQKEIDNLDEFIEDSLAMASLRRICTVDEIKMLFYKTKILRTYLYELSWYKYYCCNKNSSFQLGKVKKKLLYWEKLLGFSGYYVLKNETLRDTILHMQHNKNFWWNKQITSKSPENDYLRERIFYWNILMDIKKKSQSSVTEQNYLNLLLQCYGKLKLSFIQGNELGGFDSFKSVEDIKGLFADDDEKNYRSVFHKYYKESEVNKIELRIAPKNDIDDYVNLITKLDYYNEKESQRCKEKNAEIQYGLIVHFIKSEKSEDTENIKTYGEHKKCIEDSYLQKADRLMAFIEKNRKFSHRIVGIDTANYEKDNPPEFYVKLYKRFVPLKKRYNIHYTFHVGEAFNCLITGIRHVYEVINYLSYSPGDRVGHALALGFKVKKYFKRKNMEIICTKIELLDNLVWMFEMVKNSKESIDNALMLNTLFDDNAFWLSNYLGKQTVAIQEYSEFYRTRFEKDEEMCLFRKRKNREAVSSKKVCLSKVEKLKLVFKYSEEFYTESRETVVLKANKELVELVKLCQKLVMNKMIEDRIYIEANPTSNRKMSAIDHYEDLPLFKQAKYNLKLAREDVLTSINTDDSALFQTNLSTEYGMVALSLRKKNFSSDEMLEYMDRIREISNLISFVDEAKKANCSCKK